MTIEKRSIYCHKLKKNAMALDNPPMPGRFGQKIFDHISAEAWQLWLKHQTMLINENRLLLSDPKVRAYLKNEMQDFLFKNNKINTNIVDYSK